MEGFRTRSLHGSGDPKSTTERPLSEPIHQVADYVYESAEHYSEVINERRAGQVYGRYGNETLDRLAETLASLEKTESAWIFSSGMGAIHAVMMHLASAGDRLVAARTLYGGTYGLFTEGAARAGIKVDFADSRDPTNVEAALQEPAKAVFIETIANPTFELADIESISMICQKRGVPLVVDNTVATPALFNPIDFGATLVVHSTSKYIGGHHDLMGGAVAGPADRMDEIRHLAIRYGTTASALESWLALRGVATLGLRMQCHSENALAVALALEAARGVQRVVYPGLESHPQHDLVRSMLRGTGGMLAVDLGSRESAWAFMDALRIVRVGSSFGGVRSECTHPATTSHRQFSRSDRAAAGIGEGLVRISVGIEDAEDLVADVETALKVL